MGKTSSERLEDARAKREADQANWSNCNSCVRDGATSWYYRAGGLQTAGQVLPTRLVRAAPCCRSDSHQVQQSLGWQVKNPVVFKTPRAFAHPCGAVTWVRLAAKQTKSGSLRGAGEQEPASSASSLSSDDSRSSSTSASSASSPDDARSLRHTSKQEPASRRRSNHLATSLAGEI